jgi:kynurenine formamidase
VRADPTEEDGAIAARGNWGRWGADDERGTLNLLTAELVLDAVRTVRTGKVYALGAPVQREGVPLFSLRPRPERLTFMDDRDQSLLEEPGMPEGVGSSEEVLSFPSHMLTHIDALCHVHAGGVIYNGHPQSGMRPFPGAERCGVQEIGAIAARGVLVDVAAALGVPALEPGQVVTVEDVERALERQGSELRAGDAVLIRTGWLESYLADPPPGEPLPQPGIGVELAEWLGELDLALVGADNLAVEALPLPPGQPLIPHVELLVNRGVHMVETLMLGELAADERHEFLFVLGPLLITGATASPVNPIAIG